MSPSSRIAAHMFKVSFLKLTDTVLRQVLHTLKRPVLPFLLAGLSFTLASPTWAETGAKTGAKTLSIGTISATPVDEIRTFKPFADYLASKLVGDGVKAVKVVIAADIHQMAKMLKNGEADLFIDSSITALAVNRLAGSQYMLRRWKKGRGQYRSVIFVRDDSAITELADLKGKVIAFEEAFSTSGFMLPALAVRNHGLDLVSVKSVHSAPPADKVGYIMALDNETQTTWVERNRVHAAAMAENDFNDFAETALTPLRMVHVTTFVPYHVISHRSGLDGRLVARLKVVLKSAHETEQGRSVLMDFERTAKFDDIPPNLMADVIKLAPFLNMITSPQE